MDTLSEFFGDQRHAVDLEQQRLAQLERTNPLAAADAYRDHAVILLLEGRYYLKYQHHPVSVAHQRSFALIHMSRYNLFKWFELIAATLLLLLALIEKPAVFTDIPNGVPIAVELVLMLFFVWDAYHRAQASGGFRRWLSHRGNQLRLVGLVAIFTDIFTSFSTDHIRPFRMVRPLFLVDAYYAASIRRVVLRIFNTSVGVVDMFMLLLVYILVCAVISYQYFSPTKLFHNQKSNGDPYFSSFDESFVSLFVAITTANYPDVSLFAFHNDRSAGIFFVLYMFFGVYFILSLFLAVVYNTFSDIEKDKFQRMLVHERRGLRRAFAMLVHVQRLRAQANGGATAPTAPHLTPEAADRDQPLMDDYETERISADTFSEFMAQLQPGLADKPKTINLHFEYLSQISQSEVGMAASDKPGISLNAFYQLYTALTLRWQLDPRATLASKTDMPRTEWSTILQEYRSRRTFSINLAFVDTALFEFMIQLTIVANMLYVVVTASLNNDSNRASTPTYIFFAIYVVEAACKILHWGPRAYFRSTWNCFDFLIVIVSLSGFIQQWVQPDSLGTHATIYRALRLFRLFRLRKSMRQVLQTMVFLVGRLGHYVIALLLIFYSYAIIGMLAFSNTTSECGAECGSAYDMGADVPGFYQLMSFDNILYSYYTLFALMIVNNWQFIMQGHVAATSRAARVFFVVYMLFIVNIVSNIITAYLLDAFLKLHPLIASFDDKHASALEEFCQDPCKSREADDDGEGNGGNAGGFQELLDKGALSGQATVRVHFPCEALTARNESLLFQHFLLDVTRSANDQKPFEHGLVAARFRAGYVHKIKDQEFLVLPVALADVLVVTSSLEAPVLFRRRVLPTVYRLHQAYMAGDAEDGSVSSEHAGSENRNPQAVHAEGVDGESELVHHLVLPHDVAIRAVARTDKDWRKLRQLRNSVARHAPFVSFADTYDMHYMARRQLTRGDVNQALWGDDIERWCAEDDADALTQVTSSPRWLLDLRTLRREDHGRRSDS
ncbi:uncharacterized protein MONBRDRAFT_30365 [Monosiga brevicollis MX1]|uniref:Ion transport domain-containing protein n=1 Tax=Monosiga brevicollis TaxID=81824 RepID=A9VDS1_MONBE|nr:uncharacterized protein MONBRDRAFT_30365 [Monosiga brevicollis MX1]EDQ84309.1 predicted protein [Monosiga brevicollis MX1]|eukprot:XP_001750879.1 hypothetical protein [Monosiga brevicollis MX1]